MICVIHMLSYQDTVQNRHISYSIKNVILIRINTVVVSDFLDNIENIDI